MLIKLIDKKGKYLGLVDKSIAKSIALKEKQDLICINNKLNPKIFKIGDIKKHIYDSNKKKKKIKNNIIKEIRFRTEISDNDYLIKIKKINNFLLKYSNVRIVVFKRFKQNLNLLNKFIERIKKNIGEKFNFNIFHKNNFKNYIINISNAKKK
ncbi:translation initiation factor IF-3 [Candidatus Vidania fulgoroideorum]